jgi:uncharacterized protein (TIGR00725 family)
MVQRAKRIHIAVVGGSSADQQTLALAEAVGKTIAAKGGVLICGGLGGVMEAAARGAKEKGGITVGILPSFDGNSGNPFIDITIPTGMGHGRNMLVVASGDLVIALPGSHGTQSEVANALLLGRKVLGLKAWGQVAGVQQVNNIEDLERELLPIF